MIRYLKALTTTISLLTAAGCGMVGLPFTGQVTDSKTGEPIEGAIVVAMWRGHAGLIAHANRTCYHVETALSDENGKFRIRGWLGGSFGVLNRHVVTTAYKKGYEEAQGHDVYGDHEKHKDEIKMTRFSGAPEKRLNQLSRLVGPLCDRNNEELLNLSNEVFAEAREIAPHHKLTDWMLYELDILKYGLDEAHARLLDREKQ